MYCLNMVIWKEPPGFVRSNKGFTQQDLKNAIKELKTKPGEWAVIRTFTNINNGSTMMGRYKRWHPECEFTCRTEDDGAATLYGRYRGLNAPTEIV